jgi:SPP1 gp7 family putative phage head morphogenesis protein
MDREQDCACAVALLDEVVRAGFRVEIEKALDPLDPEGFVQIVARLSRAMSRATERTEEAILRKAIQNLDVDWGSLTAERRARIIEAARTSVASASKTVIPAIQQELRVAGPRVVTRSRRGERRRLSAEFRTRIGASMSLRDQRIVRHMVRSQAHFVRDEYGRRAAAYSRQARAIVAEGVFEGLGREEIAELLDARLGVRAGMARSRAYWNVVAATFAARSRTYAQLASYDEAGIERYVFEAVLDERTTDQCASLHGRTFETQKSLELFRRVEASRDPEDVKDITPWLRVGRDPEGRRVMFTQARNGTRTFVGEVVRSRVGQRDALPQLRGMKSSGDLQEMGLSMPPLHGLCRSTIVADV